MLWPENADAHIDGCKDNNNASVVAVLTKNEYITGSSRQAGVEEVCCFKRCGSVVPVQSVVVR